MQIRTNNLDEIMNALEDGVLQFMNSDSYKEYLKAVGRFHNYSTNNIMLITMQKPDASLVAGYSTWKKHFNRNVMRGEKGIKIIAPMPVTVEKEQDKVDQYGNTFKEKVLVTIPKFHAVTVFDISQTEGDPLPDISPTELKADVKNYDAFIEAVKSVSPVPIDFMDIEGSAKGYFNVATNRISVANNMSQSQTMKTMIHEIAHSLLHNKANLGVFVDTKTKEVQAESVAFSVCSYFGIDTSEYTFPYVSAWSGDKDIRTLKDSLDLIKTTSSQLINQIEEKYGDLTKDRFSEKELAEKEKKGAER